MRSVLRVVVGVVLGAIVGTVVFLIMIQGSFHQGYTDLDFNHVLGTMIKGSAEEATGAARPSASSATRPVPPGSTRPSSARAS